MMQVKSFRSAAIASLCVGAALSVSTCGRVSFIADGQVGDGGSFGGSSGTARSSSQEAPSSSEDTSSGGACGPDRGPRPVFQVTEADVTGEFASAWVGRGCKDCHVPSQYPLDPNIPENPNSDQAATAAALTHYCKTVGMFPVENLTADTIQHTRIICQLVPTSLTGDPGYCTHAGAPANSETPNNVAAFAGPCIPAAARYRDALFSWLDAGVGSCEPDAGAEVDGGAGGVDCMRAAIDDEFQTVWERAGTLCVHCHAGGFVSEAACFDLSTREIAKASFCDRARTGIGPLQRATYEETILYRATRDDINFRLRCMSHLHDYHQDFMEEGMDDAARTWYEAIFSEQ